MPQRIYLGCCRQLRKRRIREPGHRHLEIEGLTVLAGPGPAAGSRPDIASPVALGESQL
jgi:hypothetical protein